MKQYRIIDADKIHVLSIKTLSGNIECGPDADASAIASHEFSFGLGTGLNPEDNIVGLKLVVEIEARDKKDRPLPIKGSYTHEMIFRVDNLEEFIENNGTEDIIDGLLGSTLVSIIYSTVRGIIYSRTQGTSLGVVIIPVIAPIKLMELGNEEQEKQSSNKVKKKRAVK